MLKKIAITAGIFLFASSIYAAENSSEGDIKIKTDNPGAYTVVKGDTLWDISGRFLEQPWHWPEVWQVNPEIANPHLIYPGDVINLVYEDGRPVLYVNRQDSRYKKLSPEVRASVNDASIPTIPIDVIQHFLSRPLVMDAEAYEELPYVVGSYENHLIAGPGTLIYVRGDENFADGQTFSVYRLGDEYLSYADTEEDKKAKPELLGNEAIHVGEIVLQQAGDPAKAVIVSSTREMLPGDRLFPSAKQEAANNFYPKIPEKDIEGKIIHIADGATQIGQYQVVVLDVGQEDGVEVGNVLSIYQEGDTIDDVIEAERLRKEKIAARTTFPSGEDAVNDIVAGTIDSFRDMKNYFDETFPAFANQKAKPVKLKLPEENVGVMMVFRTFDKLSYAIIMEITGAVHVHDSVKNI